MTLIVIPQKGRRIVHYLDDHFALVHTPEDKEVVGLRIEAFIKALGEGLSMPLDKFDVSIAFAEPARLLRVEDDPDAATRWSLISLFPEPGYIGAIAVEGKVEQISS